MTYKKIEIGDKYGRWTVLQPAGGTKPYHWLCRCECGNEAPVEGHSLRSGQSRSCGCLKIEKARELFLSDRNPRRGNGEWTDSYGYVYLRAPDHPGLTNPRNPYMRRARLVMEGMLGRYLLNGERVWHLNGNKGDDRPENLSMHRPTVG